MMKLTAVFLFLAALIGGVLAQPVVISGDAGFNAGSPYNRLYDTRTVVTVKGQIVGMEIAPPMEGMGNAITILVKADKGKTWHVDVGPEWYINNQQTALKVKDKVSVTGSRVTINGHDVILAEQVVKGKNVLALRRPMGRPYWDAVVTESPIYSGRDKVKLLIGQITAIDTFTDGTNGPTQRLLIHTDDGDMYVALAPDWFMRRQALQLAVGNTINVNSWAPVGTPVSPAGSNLPRPPIVFATSIGFGQQWMVLRSVNGRPMWYGIGE